MDLWILKEYSNISYYFITNCCKAFGHSIGLGLCIVLIIAGIDLSQEIFAIDVLRALKYPLEHRPKHVLRWLRLYEVIIIRTLSAFSSHSVLNYSTPNFSISCYIYELRDSYFRWVFEYVKFYVAAKIFFNDFQPSCLCFSSFSFVVLSASYNDILAGVSGGSLMR